MRKNEKSTYRVRSPIQREAGISRRDVLKGIAAAGIAAGAGTFPAIANAGEKEIKIGFLAPLTGLETILGQMQVNCFKLAVDHINEAGGVNGHKIRYVIEDDQTTTLGTQSKARKLVYEDNVDVLIGCITAVERDAALSVCRPAGKLFLFPTYSSGGQCDKLFVGTGQVPNQQIDPVVPWLIEHYGKSVYILGSNYIWPKRSASFIKAAYKRNGGQVLGERYFPFGTQDFGSVLHDIEKAKPDLVWTMEVGTDLLTFLKQYRGYGLKPQLMTPLDEIFTRSQPHVTSGCLSSMSYFMAVQNDVNRKFLKDYKARYGDSPVDAIGESTYDATWLYVKAVQKARSAAANDVVKTLPEVSFNGPQGRVWIDKKNNFMTNHSMIAMSRDDGSWKVLKDFGDIKPEDSKCDLTHQA